jgi:hypothetical protein
MTPQDPTDNKQLDQLLEDLLEVIKQEQEQEKEEATTDDYFDPSVWEQK